MSGIASGARAYLAYVAEEEEGVTPENPTMKIMRATSRSINLEKGILESQEPNPRRIKRFQRHGFNQIVGSPGYELSLVAQDDMLAAALGGDWATVTTDDDVSATAVSNTITRSSGSFVVDGYRPGDIVKTEDFGVAANNGTFRVTVVTATALTLDATLFNDTNGVVGLAGSRVDQGLALKTFTVERLFADIQKYEAFRGTAVNTLQMSVQPEQLVSGSFGLIGMSTDGIKDNPLGASLEDDYTPSPITDPMSSFDGALYEGGEIQGVATGVDFTLDNGRTLQGVIGSRFSPCVFEGEADITGTLSLFFRDEIASNKFVDETPSALWFRLDDPDGVNFINVVFYRVKYNGNTVDPAREGPVVQSIPFTALEDPAYGTAMSIQRSNI